MELRTITLHKHFFLYCALIFNDNKTIVPSENTIELQEEIEPIFLKSKLKKIDMEMHRYKYLIDLLNNETDNSVREYLTKVEKMNEIQDLWSIKEAAIKQELKTYENELDQIKHLFHTKFNFEPDNNVFYVTKNWDKSGMCIPTKDAYYIFVGDSSKKFNKRNVVHEITHAFIEDLDLNVSNNIKETINNLPEEIFNNYKKAHVIMYESLVRALVIYLTESEKLGEQDLVMELPQKYLNKLESDSEKVLSKKYLENLVI